MLSKLKFIFIILCFCIGVDVVYGNKINKLEDLLDDRVSLKDKVGYLSYIKYDGSFSKEDIDILMRVFEKNETFDFEYELGIIDQPRIHNNSEDIDKKDKIRGFILEILLKDNVNEEILTLSQMSWIAFKAVGEVDSSDIDIGCKKNRYLALKVLIKINELRPNTDDNISKGIRDVIYDDFEDSLRNNPNEIEDEIESLLQDLYPKDKDKISELRSLFSLNNPKKMLRKIEKNRSFYAKANVWQHRSMVEDHIFDPILLELGGGYIEKDREMLYDYEKYLLDHLKFFSTTDNLKRLVEASFFKTRFLEFRSRYIDAMFFLDMEETLVKIILDNSIDIELRKKAMEISIDLLGEINVLAFKKFSKLFLEAMKKIYSDQEESTEIKSEAYTKIEFIESMIAKRNEIKDIESIISSPNISKEEKLEYLDELIDNKFYFFKQDLGIIKNILDSKYIDVEIKAKVSFMVLYANTVSDLLTRFTNNDIESMVFLFMNFIYNCNNHNDNDNDNNDSNMINTVFNNWKNVIDVLEKKSISGTFSLYYRLDMWKNLIDYLRSNEKNSTMRVLALKMSLDLLSRTKSFNEFSSAFLRTLQKISEDQTEYQGLRNMSDYILRLVNSGKVSLKEGSCIFNFMF